MKMHLSVTYSILWLFILASTFALFSEEGCEECTFQIDESIACVNELLKKMDRFTLFKSSPCQSCDIYGIHDFKRTPDHKVCSHKTAGGGVRHKYQVTFTNLTMKCECLVPANVNQLLLDAASAAIEFNTQNCPARKQLEGIESFVVTGLPPLNPNDLQNIPACKSIIVPKNEPDGKSASGKGNLKVKIGRRKKRAGKNKQVNSLVKGEMIVEWLQPQITFESTTHPKTGKVSISHVTLLTTDYAAMRAWCGGSLEFSGMCECLVAGKFQVYLIAQILHLMLPCRVNDEAKKHNDIIDYFKCDV